jgi:hypothetical protein
VGRLRPYRRSSDRSRLRPFTRRNDPASASVQGVPMAAKSQISLMRAPPVWTMQTLKIIGLTLSILLGSSLGPLAGEVRKGATMVVKPDTIWFEDAARLTRWQQLKKGTDPGALASYQDAALSTRDAWQFTNALTVEILRHEPRRNQVNVKMKTPGRFLGTTWWLDGDALVP